MEGLSRRRLLGRGGRLAAGAGLAIAPAAASSPGRKLKVVACGGHPGDPEYGCGGTLARYADRGDEVVLLYLNEGNPRPEQPPEPGRDRVAEAKRACAILGARPVFAGQVDGRAVIDEPHYRAFRALLAAEKPDVLFTHWPIDNHADHRAITMLAHDAWQSVSKGFALYYYEVSTGEDTVQFAPTHLVDITATEPRKRQACYAHASQSPERYYELQDLVARMRGIECGRRRAEGFIRHVQGPNAGLPGP
ncbi:GlcNAc-PI de-N-acetylase [Aquisphaera giovannonii]|uniref:GlcNAc-PI de-N-acetylase n=1 Tax=Aquisphaera giovannonii TaxID=406548 RepID=A0A5B9VXM6_9BACT|nr:PIG-L deacetylase family protein [Aquisphaera giovannonii]QEH32717.1 GlcNAc-PI de-N-acetylase [Aquisphaera giovannonii]